MGYLIHGLTKILYRMMRHLIESLFSYDIILISESLFSYDIILISTDFSKSLKLW